MCGQLTNGKKLERLSVLPLSNAAAHLSGSYQRPKSSALNHQRSFKITVILAKGAEKEARRSTQMRATWVRNNSVCYDAVNKILPSPP